MGIYKDRLREVVGLQEVVAMSVLTVFILTDLELLLVIMASNQTNILRDAFFHIILALHVCYE